MDLVNRSGKFDTKFQGFTGSHCSYCYDLLCKYLPILNGRHLPVNAGTDGPLGKRMENSKTRAEIGWQPKYPSFTEFLGLSN